MYRTVLAVCLSLLLLVSMTTVQAAPTSRLLDNLRVRRSADADDSASSTRVEAPQEPRLLHRARRSPTAAMINHMISMCMRARTEKCAFTVTTEGRTIQVTISEE